MKIIGISAYYHDSAAAIVVDGKIIAAAQEERFTRVKHDATFPHQAIRYCLLQAGLSLCQIDVIVYYDKPLLKFERLLETYYALAPRGLFSFLKAMPKTLREKLFLKYTLQRELQKCGNYDKKRTSLLFSEHHLSHGAGAFFASPFQEAAILTIDGVGEWATASISHGKANEIKVLKELHFPHSLGLLYSAFTYFLGFKVNSGEYKLMGLAPYGQADSPRVAAYLRIIRGQLTDVKPDGSIWLHQNFFNYAGGLRMVRDAQWQQLFGFAKRKEDEPLQQQHCDLALAIQLFTEEVVLLMAAEAKRLTGAQYLCMAGGVALNCVANGKLWRSKLFEAIFVQPAAGDAGGALGAALAGTYIYSKHLREKTTEDLMQGSYLGPSFSAQEILTTIKRYGAVYREITNEEELVRETAAYIANDKVVGWFQGRMEFGPRALGNRSILADARNTAMQQQLNLKIKQREGFRPFAPAVKIENVKHYFDIDTASPYMLFTAPVRQEWRKALPANYDALNMTERLAVPHSTLPVVTHVDFSARVQTVDKKTNALFWNLLDAFEKQTGCGVLVNTSFNVRGEPPVCTPADAYACFMQTEMDVLVLNNFIFEKAAQPAWKYAKKIWQPD